MKADVKVMPDCPIGMLKAESEGSGAKRKMD
jgi:hypothetical protein